jgi:peptidoglycan/LPS O-acetylase OafA/YrhL
MESHRLQLDALRAIAVSSVLLHHAWPSFESRVNLELGLLGVRLFFVLSGFLITGILLRIRTAIA